jgi:hypothetical protein
VERWDLPASQRLPLITRLLEPRIFDDRRFRRRKVADTP